MVEDEGGRRAGFRIGYVAWVVTASCGYPPLPDRPEPDAPLDGAPTSARCASVAKICGPSTDQDCCAAAEVPGGEFYRSHDKAADNAYSDTECPAKLSSFKLDTYEVTVGRFRAFVDAGQGTQSHPPAAGAGAHPKLPGSGWDREWNTNLAADTAALTAALEDRAWLVMWTDEPGANENKPMNYVTWFEAMAFCIWDGGYLPTEAEWNFAASGGAEHRAYPWSAPPSSTTLDCAHANFGGCAQGLTPTEVDVHRVGVHSPAGDGKWGHSDLVGNVSEWTLDWHLSQCQLPCIDCAGLTPKYNRALRGGNLRDEDQVMFLRSASRNHVKPPDVRLPDIGFRCARALP